MKYILALSLVLASSLAHGQMPSRQDLINSALEEYGKVAGGLYLNQKCKFLVEEKASAFETNVADIKVVLAADIGDASLLDTIQAGAKKVAESDKYKTCGDDAKEIVEKTSAHAESWSGFMRQIQARQKP